ncbi:unnamed protein product (macronuclear) [Paramecium tetraurelia]|uniref:Transmembrane protein n=1 Tax=Paramecium tetraurelia TaxID=5888 RepID=A0D993_PARTE|nr:uncharacterized protein GSPATT00014540001 [Paramecium tetraurelia]CAK79610.1 unnamed protein product [Paramecium tetraurelia]|eukprot:XP_001447007.1 hypothetical protein (macronuclear) [Paramecium tetraurelia strain d4-2]
MKQQFYQQQGMNTKNEKYELSSQLKTHQNSRCNFAEILQNWKRIQPEQTFYPLFCQSLIFKNIKKRGRLKLQQQLQNLLHIMYLKMKIADDLRLLALLVLLNYVGRLEGIILQIKKIEQLIFFEILVPFSHLFASLPKLIRVTNRLLITVVFLLEMFPFNSFK